ncbi:site-specific integrase (plasmid) [Hymenobacter tibetensis]|uniref:Site-specific integrase n=1 Tax=Hymenobacter tibetensis TaxID=497967 RepID=A0ABY4D5A6_9BACT|nr:site-specific integrase [Hymenobacter tibetensis]UOG77691.1 site-specific integrase [Hymenobacter tibetensis]
MSFSATINLRKPAQKNGLNTLRLQVIIHRKVANIPLELAWPERLFDEEAGRCLDKLPRKKQGAGYNELLARTEAAVGGPLAGKAADNNLLIGQVRAKANEIFVRYRLQPELVLTADEFLRQYNTTASGSDFLGYMETRIAERYKKGQIIENTRKSHTSTLRKLQEFARTLPSNKSCLRDGTKPVTIPFNSFTHKFAGDFDAWLKKAHKSCTNTRSGRHRNVKAYLELARRDKITFDDPYAYFVNTTVNGKWKALGEEELAALETYYASTEVGSTHRRMLQKFLFSCNCGLRLGDLKRMGEAKVNGQLVELKVQKTFRYDEKETLLPITKKALSYLQASREENGTEGFFLYTDQYTNRALQKIALWLGIKTKIHHHIGRETFATNFIRRGGKVEVLQKLMGHKKLSMTMKYVHVDEAMKQAEIDRLDALDDAA